jgi:predicted dehydrogenase
LASDLDVLIVATQPMLHAHQAIQALAAGKRAGRDGAPLT